MTSSTSTEPDPVFVDVATVVYDGVLDPRELWDLSKLDAADVHVNQAVKRRKPKPPPEPAHSNTARALVLGGVAEGLGTFRAGQEAHRALSTPAVRAASTKMGKLRAITPKGGGKIGEFGLQAANLGVGLVAARALSQHAKQKQKLGKAVLPNLLGKLRPIKVVMSEEQAAAHAAGVRRAGKSAQRLVAGTALGTGLVVGHHVGVKRGRKQKIVDNTVTKMLRPVASAAAVPGAPPPLVAGVRASNSGGVGRGLGRRGRALGVSATPAPKPLPLVKSSRAEYLARNGQRALKTAETQFGPADVQRAAKPAKAVRPPTAAERRSMAAVGGADAGMRPRRRPEIHKRELTWAGEISKVDEDKRQVFGWCSVTEVDGQPVVDRQGDYIPLDEVEKSAYTYVLESRKGGDMHARVTKGLSTEWDQPKHTADLIESVVFTPEKLAAMGMKSDTGALGWWVGFKVNDDEQWNLVKSGQRAAFSIHGTGARSDAVL